MSEGIDELTGEWWITENGITTYQDGDVGDYTHSTRAMEKMLGFQLSETNVPILPLEPLSEDAKRYLNRKGISEEIISYLTTGEDPCEYVLRHYGWVNVKNNSFRVYNYDNQTSERISAFINEQLVNDDGNIMIEEISTGKSFLTPIWMVTNGSDSLNEIKIYASEQKITKNDIINLVSLISEDLVPLALTLLEDDVPEVHKEYEKRYELKELPDGISSPSKIVQGLLFDKPGFTMRVRREISEDKVITYSLTCKFYKKSDEAEVEITREMFDKLWPETIDDKRMEKTRYKYKKWVVDDITKPEKKIVAEIELSEEDDDIEIPKVFDVINKEE